MEETSNLERDWVTTSFKTMTKGSHLSLQNWTLDPFPSLHKIWLHKSSETRQIPFHRFDPMICLRIIGRIWVPTVNVWIQDFDDVKVESNNKVVSTNIQRLSIASRIIQGQSKQDQEKDKASNNLIGWSSFCLKTHYFRHLVIDYQAV